MNRRKERTAVRKVLKEWRSAQREMMKSYSRLQLLEGLVPETGKLKTKRQEKTCEGKGKKLSKVGWITFG